MSRITLLSPTARRPQRLLAALALCSAAPACLAFGGVGFLPACATFTTCSSAVGSSAARQVRRDLTDISPGFSLPTDLVPGVSFFNAFDSNATSAVVTVGVGGPIPGAGTEFGRNAAAKAQSGFAVNRVQTSMSRGVSGILTRGSGTASLSLRTFAEATSAWRDVWAFSGSGHFSAVVAIDGRSSLGAIGPFDASFQFAPMGTYADWFYDLRVWDVTNFSVSDDFELGGPTQVGRAKLTGYNEVRSDLDGTVALDFDFVSGATYVVTAELRATSYDGREIDLFNTARLQDVVLSNGVQMSTLSGHDFLTAVPEPQTALLLATGVVALLRRRRRPV